MECNKLDGGSLNVEQMEMEKLRAVFPQCFVEGKLDIDKLLSLCGEYIDNDFEKYKFEWKGKGESLRLAQRRSMGTLRPCPQESVDWDTTQNLYIEGDNLEVLKLLQTAYYRKVKMIYIDPPYNTGNDFVYEDDFADPISRYKEVTAQTTKSNPETMGRYHTNWLNMMYPRLRLASNLLRDDGVIFISIDDNEVHNLRKVCDEVFGEENFIAQTVWQRAFSPKNDSKYTSNDHDYVLIYAKNVSSFEIGRLPRTEEANSRYTNPDNDPRGEWVSGDLTVKTYSESYDYPITTPNGTVINPAHGSCWRVSKERFEELVNDNRVWFGPDGGNVPRLKRFLCDVQDGMVASSLMLYKDVGHSQEGRQETKKLFDDKGYFDGPKPLRLLRRLLTLANTSGDDIILDFFSGSATTAHAVMQLNAEDGGNRRFIMVQLPEVTDEKSEAFKAGYKTIAEIGKERIRRAGAKIKAEWEAEQAKKNNGLFAEQEENQTPPDTGFKVFKLDTSNLKTWDTTPVDQDDAQQLELLLDRMNDMVDTIKPDRTDSDMVYEIMLKMGVPLDYPVVPIEIGGKRAYSIGEESLLLVCLQGGLTTEIIEQMAEEYLPSKIILSEKCFANDTAMANAHYILKDRQIELKLV